MKRRGVFLLALTAWALSAQPSVRFQGEVTRGREFRKEIGSSLFFVLRPTSEGWGITVQPAQGPVFNGCEDFVWVVTPPYRSSNPRYLDTSYGIDAAEAVRWSPREFQFVLTGADCKTESDRVQHVLWPYNYSDREVQEAEAKLGTSPTGKGFLTILDSKINAAMKTTEGKDPGRIDWLKFAVEITFPRKR